MNEGDLTDFVDRAGRIVQRSPSMDAKATDLRIVLPFLKTLGWDVHGTDLTPSFGVETDEGPIAADYALCLDGRPAIVVVTAGVDVGLSPADGDRLTRVMHGVGVEWGMAIGGQDFVFVTHEGGEERTVACTLGELAEEAPVLSHYTRSAAVERRERRVGQVRESAAEALAGNRPAVVDAVHTALSEATGDAAAIEGELRSASESFVDGVADALAAADHPTAFVDASTDLPATTTDAGPPDDGSSPNRPDASPESGSSADRTGGNGETAADTARPGERGDAMAGEPSGSAEIDATTSADATAGPAADPGNGVRTADDGDDGDGSADDGPPGDVGTDGTADEAGINDTTGDEGSASEYVVRFFNGRSSVGAVGHSTSGGAMAQAIEYMIEQHALDSRLDLPWNADGKTLVNYEPVHPDGSRMASARQLSNGYYVNTGIPAKASQTVVEELADNSGLRVMFRGDWPS